MSGRPRDDRRPRWRTVAASWLGTVIVRALGATWRLRVEGEDVRTRVRAGEAAVLALWHGELLPLVWYHRDQEIAALISTHADGEVIARVVSSLGFRPIRGSSSRGGARALLEAVRELQGGRDVAFTTDGPRGPRHVSAPGVGVAAAKAGVPVIPMGAVVDRAWRLRSWDQFVIPKPFARITVRYAPALRAAGSGTHEGEAIVPAIDAALLSVCQPDAA
ncbi:MAG: lysophospholipid acyltransferase family protein [Gemmatimonadaceae bacterium]